MEDFWTQLNRSLTLLKTDYIDIYQFHNPAFCPKPGDGTGLYEAMLEAKAQGKIRFIGMTNHRLSVAEGEGRPVRICELAEKLHVSPSSASRMAQSMAVWGYLDFKRYGYITMTEKGMEWGEYLMRRHSIVVRFLGWLNGEGELAEAERIEHYLSRETVAAMERILLRDEERNAVVIEER